MWMTVKTLLTLLFVLIFSLLTAFSVAVDELSETETKEKSDNGNKKAAKLMKFATNENDAYLRLTGVKMLSAFFSVGFGVLAYSKAFKILLCSLVDAQNVWTYRIMNLIGCIIIIFAVALVLYICGEVFAKAAAFSYPKAAASGIVGIASLLCGMAKPFWFLLDKLWAGVSTLFGTNPDIDEEVTEEEIRQMVDAGEESGVLLESQREIINNIFEFDDISVSDIMNHRTEIIAIDVTEKLDAVLKLAIDEGFSRIPVFEDDLDNIIGIIYVKDLLKYVGKKLPEKMSVRPIMRPAYHVPQTKRCVELFKEMTEQRVQMAIVIDEYGGTAGIVTLEDLIESVLGNIQDEYDDEEDEISKVNETTFKIDGTCDIKEVEEMLMTTLPEGDYDTLGGMILAQLGRIPKDDEQPSVEVGGFKFTAVSVKERRIEEVKAEKLPDDSDSDDK